ncbi:MAG: TetR/AcrR family transcriptional regulator [Streptosporangiaceae bacterium]|jgi:AcrR family transcriptional regulator
MTRAEQADREREAAAPQHRGNRWGRSEHARQAVLEAADDLLAERGFAGLTIEGIAAAAGVAKQTIYRWWNSKTDILMDALLQDAAEHLIPADHGDLGEDLRDQLSRVADFLTRSDPGAVCRALIGQALHDPAFAAVFRSRFLAEQRERDRLPLDRAITRGQLPAGTDVLSDIDELLGPIYYRVLVTAEPVDRSFTDRLVDHYLRRFEP